MVEIKWIKITTNMFDDEKVKLIDAMPERDTIHYIWIRLLVQAGKTNANGYIFLNEHVPYTEEMLSTIFNRPLNSIRLALNTLSSFGMIKIGKENLLKISNWEKHQNVEGMEKVREQNRLRKQKQREREKLCLPIASTDSNVSRDSTMTITEQNKSESKNIDKDIDKEVENKCICKNDNVNNMKNMKNSNETHTFSVELLSYFENATGKTGELNLGAIKIAILQHGKENVRNAIDKAIEYNKPYMQYINTILKNWAKEGYTWNNDNKTNNASNVSRKGKKLTFTDYPQREYDYDSLEKKLLGWD
ncbi:hypothetical protein CPJCM30710_10970 [Clostridium polyendosporum]|uniref:Phage replisome organiser N-terminal domain-containing protein n=1 Tax=Clostridium polyendosporum TaxID=69208 RepID=A0A919RY01_9CLOT|nr:phage replisome organizer N-terminal domain-containing protein [Clostridium polyendosporum]GIM28431.1 hypothetical protein CPJCM30710_10970 [Clostridium polyendosporum]